MTKRRGNATLALEKFALRAVCAALAVGAAWLFFRYALPWTAPFLVAALLAAVIEPPVAALARRGWPRAAASGLLSLALLGALGALAAYIIAKLITEAALLADAMPGFLDRLGDTLASAEDWALSLAADYPAAAGEYIRTALDSVTETLYSLPVYLSEKLLSLAGALARSSPSVLLFSATAAIGVYFISASRPEIMAFARAQIPERFHPRLRGAKGDLGGTLTKMLTAQLILIAMTFAELLTAFTLLGVRGAVTLALAVALVDALPVLGTGTVLIPWALYSVISGDVPLGVGLAVTYGVVTVLRSCVQPKLIGDRLGLHPVVSLAAIYVGWCACGVWGMLLFPVLAVMIKRLNDRGVVNLWRRGEEKT